MGFSLNINLGSVSPTITSVRLLACTGSTCNNGTVISGYENVLVSSFPRIVTGIPDQATSIKVESLGNCTAYQCIIIQGLPGTPTPTPTIGGGTTNTPTPTPAPVYYSIYDCYDGAHYYSELKPYGTIPIYGSPPYARVYGFAPSRPGVGTSFTVQGSTNTQQSTQISIQYMSGEVGCYYPPTETPVPLYTMITLVRGGTNTWNNLQYSKDQLCGNYPNSAYNYVHGESGGGAIFTKYITYELNGLQPSTTYTVYNTANRTPGDEFNGGNYKYGVMIPYTSGKITHIVEVSPSGVLQNWSPC